MGDLFPTPGSLMYIERNRVCQLCADSNEITHFVTCNQLVLFTKTPLHPISPLLSDVMPPSTSRFPFIIRVRQMLNLLANIFLLHTFFKYLLKVNIAYFYYL